MTLIFFLNVRSTLIELSSTFAKTSAISSGFLRYTLGELPPPFAPNQPKTGFLRLVSFYFNFSIFKFNRFKVILKLFYFYLRYISLYNQV